MKRKYFASYCFRLDNVPGYRFGNSFLDYEYVFEEGFIRNAEKAIELEIQKKGKITEGSVIILNIQELK